MKLSEFTENPMPLYVSRKLLNAKDLIMWAKYNGWKTPLKPNEMHVTVVYSREPVVWSRLKPLTDTITISNGTRELKLYGEDNSAAVLVFESDVLHKRWTEFQDIGASWDYPQYTPHVTITYHHGILDHDISTITPFDQPLIFGPEIFEPLELDWSADKN